MAFRKYEHVERLGHEEVQSKEKSKWVIGGDGGDGGDWGYEEWRERILKYVETDDSLWKAIGDWLYPKHSYRASMNHLCLENYKRNTSNAESFDVCKGCGAKVPDGIKMITLLERL